jgi:hypothetical protein
MGLRLLHLVFILTLLPLTDMFGAWAVHEHSHMGDGATLVWGMLSFTAGFALIGYTLLAVRKFQHMKAD